MSYPNSITESLILVVFLLLSLISIQLLRTSKGILLSNKLLGTLFSLLSLQILISYLTVTQVLVKPIFILIDDTLLLGVGPLLLLYVKTTIKPSRKKDLADLIHFIPLIFLLVPFLFFLFITTDYSQWLLGFDLSESIREFSTRKFQWTSFLMVTHITFYLIWATHIARNSKENSTNYKWVKFTLMSFVIIVAASYIQLFRPLLFSKEYQPLSFILILITLLIFLIRILIKGMDGESIFSEHRRKRYENSKLGSEEKRLIHDRLRKLIEEDKLYLRADLTISELAETMNTHPKNVSQVVNELFSQTFYDLINQYRIDHAVELLSDPTKKDLTIAEIQHSSGFNSKSSFHTQFKRRTGKSPKEFKRNQV